MLVYNSARMRMQPGFKGMKKKTYSGCAYKIYILNYQLNNYRPFLQLINSIVM